MDAAALRGGSGAVQLGRAGAEPLLELREVRAEACDAPVSFALAGGERLALVGANGVGKTTLLRIIVGLAAPAAGAVMRNAAPVAYVPQDYRASLFPWFSVRKNLALSWPPPESGGRPRVGSACPDADTAIADALEVVPLPRHLLARDPGRLSGGEQQLVAVARALVGAPRLLVLDEPFAALDAPTRTALIRGLDVWLAARETALVLVSHAIDEIVQLSERALVLRAGGSPRAIDLIARRQAAAVLYAALEEARIR